MVKGITLLRFIVNKTTNFLVTRCTFPSGNMPHDIGHNVFYGQVLRFAELCSDKDDFITLTIKLFKTLHNRGYLSSKLKKKFRLLFLGRPNLLFKFGFTSLNDLADLVFT